MFLWIFMKHVIAVNNVKVLRSQVLKMNIQKQGQFNTLFSAKEQWVILFL